MVLKGFNKSFGFEIFVFWFFEFVIVSSLLMTITKLGSGCPLRETRFREGGKYWGEGGGGSSEGESWVIAAGVLVIG